MLTFDKPLGLAVSDEQHQFLGEHHPHPTEVSVARPFLSARLSIDKRLG